MPNFIKRVFSNNSKSNSAAPENAAKPEDTLTLTRTEPDPGVERRVSRKTSSCTPRSHDLDPTIEMEKPSFDVKSNKPDQREIHKEISTDPWNVPTTEVFLPA